jgi:hypothetical protein
MTINDLSLNTNLLQNRESLLSAWTWLIGPQKQPILITICGDAFVQDEISREVHFLDTVNGSIELVANDEVEFRNRLNDKDFVMKHFAVSLIAPKLKEGQVIKEDQVYSFIVPPVLGGKYSRDNLEATDVSVHFGLLGQIWEKVGVEDDE